MEFFEVGGCVRDDLLGIKTKDVDFAVEMTGMKELADTPENMFNIMRGYLAGAGFKEFEVKPEFFTIRAQVPDGHELMKRTRVADFVMCRKEGPYSDGRRPDWVEIGDIFDDLARRDFTMNAIARDLDGQLIDPHFGVNDINSGLIRFVGDPYQRIREDGLRVLRALRFSVTKNFFIHPETSFAMKSKDAIEALSHGIADERIQQEIDKMMHHDSIKSILLLNQYPQLLPVIFGGKVRLAATMKK